MANRIAFQTQLASIMEVLANAAVAEICKLVDDDYAVVNLQMTQCQRENKALKRKLHIMELKMARSHAERRTGSLNRANRVQVNAALSEKYRNQTNVVYGAPFNTRLWRGGGTEATVQQTTVPDNNRMAEDPVISEVGTVLIKEEMFEENQTQQRLIIRDGVTQNLQAREADLDDPKDDDQVSGMQQHTLEQQKEDEVGEPETLVLKEDLNNQWEGSQKQEPIIVHDVESDTEICSGRLSTSPVQSAVALGAEKLVDSDFSHLRENGLDRSQKTDISPSIELQIQDVMECSPSSSKQYRYHRSAVGIGEKAFYTNSENKGAVQSSTLPTNQPMLSRESTTSKTSGTDCSLYERPAENRGRLTRWAPQTSTSMHSSCSYTTDSNQDCMLVQSEPVSSVRGSKVGQQGPQSTRTHGVRSADAPDGSFREKEAWTQSFTLRQAQTEPSGHISRQEGETTSTTNPSYYTMGSQMMSSYSQPGFSLAGMNLQQHIEKGKRKGYICKYCGKAFPGMSNVVAHQRVHTGERPFKCDICGKLFTEAGNLKKHQRVHTGEKPYTCNRCGKQFAWICNLKTHQQSACCGGV